MINYIDIFLKADHSTVTARKVANQYDNEVTVIRFLNDDLFKNDYKEKGKETISASVKMIINMILKLHIRARQ